jgi:hypothetical protein
LNNLKEDKNNIFQSVDPFQRCNFTTLEAAIQEYPCLTDGPTSASFWVTTEYNDGELLLVVLSLFPYPYHLSKSVNQHGIEWEIENSGIEDFFGIDNYYGVTLADFLLQEGIAPEQPFRVMARVSWTGDGVWEEIECYKDIEVIGKETWTIEQILEAWDNWIKEKHHE